MGEHPIDIVVKSPFLAMKYPKTTETVRRIQVKFRRESDFSQAVQMLMKLGLSVLDKDIQTSALAVKTAIPTPESLESSAFNASTTLARSSPINFISVPENGDSCRASKPSPAKTVSNHSIVHSKLSGDFRNAPRVNFSTSGANRSFSYNPTGSAMVATSSMYQTEAACQSTFSSQNQTEYQNRHSSQPIIPNLNLGGSEIQKNTNLQFSSTQPKEDKNTYLFEDRRQPLEQSSLSWSQIDYGNSWEPQLIDNFSVKTPPGSLESAVSSSAQIKNIEDQEIRMPPKRILPFLAPRHNDENFEIPAKNLPPLPKPTPVAKNKINQPRSINVTLRSETIKKKHKKIVRKESKVVRDNNLTQRENNSSLESKSDDESTGTLTAQESPNLSKLSKKAIPVKKNPIIKKRSVRNQQEKNKRPKMKNQGTQTLNFMEQNYISASENENFRNSKTSSQGKSVSKGLWHTTRYDEADDETRYSLIQDFICENLENQNFLQLCKDIEFSWQRICLGR